MGATLKSIFKMPYFRITVVPDEETVEACGALKVRFLTSIVLCINTPRLSCVSWIFLIL